jgi:hypothetical protein
MQLNHTTINIVRNIGGCGGLGKSFLEPSALAHILGMLQNAYFWYILSREIGPTNQASDGKIEAASRTC